MRELACPLDHTRRMQVFVGSEGGTLVCLKCQLSCKCKIKQHDACRVCIKGRDKVGNEAGKLLFSCEIKHTSYLIRAEKSPDSLLSGLPPPFVLIPGDAAQQVFCCGVQLS